MRFIYITIILLLVPCGNLLAAKQILVQDGVSRYSIYCDAKAPPSVRLAADELQFWLKISTGAKLPIIHQPTSPMVCLGDNKGFQQAGLTTDKIKLEGFRIVTRGENLYILGIDTPKGKTTPQGGISQGTLFGTYAFLEKYVGIRWLIPGEGGDHVPEAKKLILTEIDHIEAPDFLRRALPYTQNRRPEVKRWLLRNRIGSSIRLVHGHNWKHSIPASYHEKHPDWFALRDGKRVVPVGRYKLCTSNKGMIQAFAEKAIQAFDSNKNLKCYSLSPADSGGWCECDRCTATDEISPLGRQSITSRTIKFYNEVAKIVHRKHPDRIVCGYVYSVYAFPPKKQQVKLEPNLYLVWAPSMDYGFTLFRPELQQLWDKTLKEWSQITDNLGYYDLCVNLSNGSGAPNPPGAKILKFIFPRLKQQGVKSLYLYGESAWGHAGLLNYTLARLMWDADADVDAIIDEFCHLAYGKGATEMSQIYQLLDVELEKYYIKDKTARYQITPPMMKEVYAANYAKIEKLHQQAVTKATDANVKSRLKMFGDNMRVLNWYLRQNGFLKNAKASAYYLPMKEFNKFMTANDHSLALAENYSQMKTRRFPKLKVTLVGRAKNTAPMRKYGLRGDMNIVLYAEKNGTAAVTFSRLYARNQFVRYQLADSNGEFISKGMVERDGTIQFDATAGKHYFLQIQAGIATFAIKTKLPFAIDATTGESGLHFQAGATPLYFYASKEINRCSITLASSAPGETAIAKVYSPGGKLFSTLKTVTVPSDKVTIPINRSSAGIWKVEISKAKSGGYDDVFILPSRELSGFFSFSGENVLQIERLK